MTLTPNKRIAINTAATYGRSLYALICGLFASRWALSILGEEGYGLYGVVGGLAIFVAFLNNLMASAVGRYYAYSVGATKRNCGNVPTDDCTRWFNVAILIHTALPLALVSIGYPLGVKYICHGLNCPLDSIPACIWVWRYTCLSCFAGMCSVPFQAMFVAKQEIYELTIYSVGATTVKMIVLYYMVNHAGDWLTGYALCMCLVSVVPNILIMLRARYAFGECRIKARYFWDWQRFMLLLKFAGSRFLGTFSWLCSTQGVTMLVNYFIGSKANATLTLGTAVHGQTSTLANSFGNAFYPAITNAVGEGKVEYSRLLVNRVCVLSSLGMFVFAVPLILEMRFVLGIWLKDVPEGLVGLATLILISASVERMTDGFWMEILAFGKIACYQAAEAMAKFLLFLAALLVVGLGYGIANVGWAFLVSRIAVVIVQLHYGRRLCGLSFRNWGRKILMPLLLTILVSLSCGCVSVLIFPPCCQRLVLTVAASEAVLMVLAWFFVIDATLREGLKRKLKWGMRCLIAK